MSGANAATVEETDVVIVGAGPAGCALAYLLARSGVDCTLLERQRGLDREFRGYAFQPLAVRLFDEMGVLDPILALDHERIRTIELVAFGRRYRVIDFADLPPPHDYVLLMEQPPLLSLLIERATAVEGVEYHDATAVDGLLGEGENGDGRVVGVRARDRRNGVERRIRCRLVVGADGRFSTVRSEGGIDPGLLDSTVDPLWFKLPRGAIDATAGARLERGGLVGYFGLGGEASQVGWFVERGSYPALRERGIEALREEVSAVDPSVAGALRRHLTDFSDCSLLRISPGISERWIGDGFLLIGDAAHVASPFGGQGNALAIADAAAAHPLIVRALGTTDGPIREAALTRFEQRRRPLSGGRCDSSAGRSGPSRCTSVVASRCRNRS
jgi:2-polyprenyl-6-methoxyphenol hydroxylase-like FAD-dependent oxidoreductase